MEDTKDWKLNPHMGITVVVEVSPIRDTDSFDVAPIVDVAANIGDAKRNELTLILYSFGGDRKCLQEKV